MLSSRSGSDGRHRSDATPPIGGRLERPAAARHAFQLFASRIDVDEIAQQRIDLVVPLPAAEYAVVPDAGLHVVDAAIGAHAGAEVLRGERLPDRADVVLLALDRHQAHALDGSRV